HLLGRLGQRLQILRDSRPATPSRHRTLRAALDWSYELCDQAERTLWSRLSVFSGSFDLESAEIVCADKDLRSADMLELVGSLHDKSVITRIDHPAENRFTLLETIRVYGREKLRQRDEEFEFQRRHHDYYLHLAESIENRAFGPDQAEH